MRQTESKSERGMSGFRQCFLGRCALLLSNKQKSPESLGFCGESGQPHQG